jgi:hypothetical protein
MNPVSIFGCVQDFLDFGTVDVVCSGSKM